MEKKNFLIKNPQRRNLLKYSLLIGSGFLVGKFLDSFLGLFSSKKGFELVGPQGEETKVFKNFVAQETDKELNFYDKGGYKIFVIEK